MPNIRYVSLSSCCFRSTCKIDCAVGCICFEQSLCTANSLASKPNSRAIFITCRYCLPWNDEAERIAATFVRRACSALSSASDFGAFSTSFNSAVAVCDSSTPASSTNRIRLVCDRDTNLAKTLSSRRLRQPHAICDVSTLQPRRMWKYARRLDFINDSATHLPYNVSGLSGRAPMARTQESRMAI